MATDKETIKTWFETGDTPTEAQFAETLDSYVHQDDLTDMAKESTVTEVGAKVAEYGSNIANDVTSVRETVEDNNSKLVSFATELTTIENAIGDIETLINAL